MKLCSIAGGLHGLLPGGVAVEPTDRFVAQVDMEAVHGVTCRAAASVLGHWPEARGGVGSAGLFLREEVLIYLLEVQGLIDASANIVADHQSGKLLAVD